MAAPHFHLFVHGACQSGSSWILCFVCAHAKKAKLEDVSRAPMPNRCAERKHSR